MRIGCPLAKQCGGCSCIDMPYEEQLSQKQQRMERMYAPLVADAADASQEGDTPSEGRIHPILGMDDPQRYRSKIVSPFAPAKRKPGLRAMARTGRAGKVAMRQADIQCGLYAAGTHRIIACDNCPIEHEAGRRVVAAIRQIMARYGMVPYDEDAGTGFVRHVVVRVGAQTGEVLVTLVTNGSEFTGVKNFCRELVRRVPEVTSIVQNVNTRQTNAILGQEERVLYGPGFILDTLCGLSFRISSNSFFQVNAVQTEVLYSVALASSGILDVAGAGRWMRQGDGSPVCQGDGSPVCQEDGSLGTPAEQACQEKRPPDTPPPGALPSDNVRPLTILDAYCGTGTIGLVAAAAAPGAQVIGVDSVGAAIADARQNAQHNGIGNARFVAQDAGEFMREFAEAGNSVDVVFMDPPRSGASEDFLDALLKLAPARIVYISCNPETQVRDARVLLEGGYAIESVQPVDMFPHTDHVECVSLMSRTGG